MEALFFKTEIEHLQEELFDFGTIMYDLMPTLNSTRIRHNGISVHVTR